MNVKIALHINLSFLQRDMLGFSTNPLKYFQISLVLVTLLERTTQVELPNQFLGRGLARSSRGQPWSCGLCPEGLALFVLVWEEDLQDLLFIREKEMWHSR